MIPRHPGCAQTAVLFLLAIPIAAVLYLGCLLFGDNDEPPTTIPEKKEELTPEEYAELERQALGGYTEENT